MTEAARLALPLIEPGQAQKEWFHNEALTLLDAAVQASVAAVGLDAPPADPVLGASWIVGAAPTGEWNGRAHALATWTAGGWRFVRPREGMAVWDGQALVSVRFVGGAWDRGAVRATRLVIAGEQVVGARSGPIAEPAGGGFVDAEARATLSAILAALRGHGLIGG